MSEEENKGNGEAPAAVQTDSAEAGAFSRRGTDDRWEVEDESKGTWSGAQDTPMEALRVINLFNDAR